MTRTRVFGIAAILLALAAWAGTAAVTFTAFQSQAQWQAPGSTSTYLAAGKWVIVEKLPSDSTAFSPSDVAGARTVNVDQVTVTTSAGATVPVTCAYCAGQTSAAIPVDLQMANVVAEFTADIAGDYTLAVSGGSGRMAVANPTTKLEDQAGTVTGLGALGGALMATGILLVIRGKNPNGPTGERPSDSGSGTTPPGWYPNPYRPDSDSQMWWDGTQWTSNWR